MEVDTIAYHLATACNIVQHDFVESNANINEVFSSTDDESRAHPIKTQFPAVPVGVTQTTAGVDIFSRTLVLIQQPETVVSGTEEHLNQCTEAIHQYWGQYSLAKQNYRAGAVSYAIAMGRLFNALKPVVRKAGHDWQPWAAKHFKYITGKTRQVYMLLAKTEHVHPYAALGTDRLVCLISLSKGQKCLDSIGGLLQKYEVKVPHPDEPLDEFKKKIDAVLMTEKAQKRNLGVTYDEILDLINVKRNPGPQLLRDLVKIQNAGGDVHRHISDLIMNGGQDEDGHSTERLVKSLDKTAGEALAVMQHIMNENLEYEYDEDSLIHRFDSVYRAFLQYIEYQGN